MCLLKLLIAYGIILLCITGLVHGSLETTISQRASTRTFLASQISSIDLINILESSYGYIGIRRVLPRIGAAYSLVIYAVNSTGSYRYDPEGSSLSLHNDTVNKETIRPNVANWASDADVVLIVVWNQTIMNNPYFPSLEAGCFAQNIYLAAISRGLGTCCVGSIDSPGLQSDLGLSSNLIPLLVFPLGYPISSYPDVTPNYDIMVGNLPVVQDSGQSFTQALDNIFLTQAWSSQVLSVQQKSQLLWAAYGFSSTWHRTTPSAYGIYPLVVYNLNSTGTYRYFPENHSIAQIQFGDKRREIATVLGNQVELANAPELFLITLNSSYNNGFVGDGGVWEHEAISVNAGCVIQQILLEASVQDLGVNVVIQGLEDWNGAGAQSIRTELGLPSSIIPLSAIGVGTVGTSPSPTPTTTPPPTFSPEPTIEPTPEPAFSFSVEVLAGIAAFALIFTIILAFLLRKRRVYLQDSQNN